MMKRHDRPTRPLLRCCLLGALGALAGCADDGPPEWDSEVMLQLFASPELVDRIGTLEVRAQQPGTAERKLTIDDPKAFFGDCKSNWVRIIPAFENGALRGAIEVTVSSTKDAFETVKRPLALADAVMILGDAIDDLVPSGCSIRADGGVEPDGGTNDGGTNDGGTDDGGGEEDGGIRGGVGAPCRNALQCELGALCLERVNISINPVTTREMPDGYCSRLCDPAKTDSCGEGLACKAFYSGDQTAVGYCLVSCTGDPAKCRDGYTCTSGGLCFPDQPQP